MTLPRLTADARKNQQADPPAEPGLLPQPHPLDYDWRFTSQRPGSYWTDASLSPRRRMR